MRCEVTRATLRASRRAIGWWSIGIAGLVVLMVAVYPSIRDNPLMERLHNEYPEVIREFVTFGGQFDFTSPAGYLGAELFSMMVPLIFIVAGIGAGARAIAGEEEAGTLDLLLSMPISRTGVLLQKMLAVAIELVVLGLVLLVVLWPATAVIDMDISVGYLAAAVADVILIALVYAALALLLGAATGRRALAAGIAAAAAILAYVLNGLAPLVGALDPVRPASPWYQYVASDALRSGLAPLHAGVLLAITVVLVSLAPPFLRRRDVGV